MRDWTYPFPSLGLFWHTELFSRELGLTKDDVVLDAGVGTGHVAYALSPRARSLLGVDISAPLVECLKSLRTGRTNLQFACGDITTREFAVQFESRFDKVYSAAVLEHVENPRAFVISICSVLAKGGKAIVHFPNGKQHGTRQFRTVPEIQELFAGMPVSIRVLVARHTIWGAIVEGTYNLARSAYKHLKHMHEDTRAKAFEDTTFFQSLNTTRNTRLVLAPLLYLLWMTSRIMCPLALQAANGSIDEQVVHIQIEKNV